MKITCADILTVEIPMRFAVCHALAERRTAQNVLVAVRDESGNVGWGECCPRPYVTGETVDSVKNELAAVVLPKLLGLEFTDLNELAAALTLMLDDLRRDQQAAFCASELALLDLAGKVWGVSAGSVLGPVLTEQIRYSGVIAAGDLEAVSEYVNLIKGFGVPEIKVKMGQSLDLNLAILEKVRELLGEACNLRIDANGAWSDDEALRQLEAMEDYRLVGVEQPVPAGDLEGMRRVTAAGLVPVVADESLCSLQDAEALIDAGACDIFNVRVSKCGGLINVGRIHQRAREAGLRCQLGAQVGETGLLSVAGRHYATRCPNVLWFEGSYGGLQLEDEITEPDSTLGPDGWAPALDTPGLGVEPSGAKLVRYQTDVFRVE